VLLGAGAGAVLGTFMVLALTRVASAPDWYLLALDRGRSAEEVDLVR